MKKNSAEYTGLCINNITLRGHQCLLLFQLYINCTLDGLFNYNCIWIYKYSLLKRLNLVGSPLAGLRLSAKSVLHILIMEFLLILSEQYCSSSVAVCFRSLPCWKMNRLPNFSAFVDCCTLSSGILLYVPPSIFTPNFMSFLILAAVKPTQNLMLQPLWFTLRIVFFVWCTTRILPKSVEVQPKSSVHMIISCFCWTHYMLSHVEPLIFFLPRSLVRYELCCVCIIGHHIFAMED